MKNRIIVAALLAVVAVAMGDDPPPPGPQLDPIGACCLGPDMGVIVDITQAECALQPNAHDDGVPPLTRRERGGLWVQGDFSETDDRSPCNILPGGD